MRQVARRVPGAARAEDAALPALHAPRLAADDGRAPHVRRRVQPRRVAAQPGNFCSSSSRRCTTWLRGGAGGVAAVTIWLVASLLQLVVARSPLVAWRRWPQGHTVAWRGGAQRCGASGGTTSARRRHLDATSRPPILLGCGSTRAVAVPRGGGVARRGRHEHGFARLFPGVPPSLFALFVTTPPSLPPPPPRGVMRARRRSAT